MRYATWYTSLTWAVAVAAAISLFGCKSATTDPHPGMASIVAAEASLAAAGRVYLHYASLPPCGGTATICSDPAVKAKGRAAFDAAYDSVTKAQAVSDAGGTPDVGAMTAAISAMQSALALMQ